MHVLLLYGLFAIMRYWIFLTMCVVPSSSLHVSELCLAVFVREDVSAWVKRLGNLG